MFNFSGTASPGQYTFPFSFYLPDTIPASMWWQADGHTYGIIKYTIKAKLRPMFENQAKEMKFK